MESNYKKRLFSKMIYIKSNHNGINKKEDIQNLSTKKVCMLIYFCVWIKAWRGWRIMPTKRCHLVKKSRSFFQNSFASNDRFFQLLKWDMDGVTPLTLKYILILCYWSWRYSSTIENAMESPKITFNFENKSVHVLHKIEFSLFNLKRNRKFNTKCLVLSEIIK